MQFGVIPYCPEPEVSRVHPVPRPIAINHQRRASTAADNSKRRLTPSRQPTSVGGYGPHALHEPHAGRTLERNLEELGAL